MLWNRNALSFCSLILLLTWIWFETVDLVYLDHAGSTLYSESQMEAVFKDLTANVYGNPRILLWFLNSWWIQTYLATCLGLVVIFKLIPIYLFLIGKTMTFISTCAGAYPMSLANLYSSEIKGNAIEFICQTYLILSRPEWKTLIFPYHLPSNQTRSIELILNCHFPQFVPWKFCSPFYIFINLFTCWLWIIKAMIIHKKKKKTIITGGRWMVPYWGPTQVVKEFRGLV